MKLFMRLIMNEFYKSFLQKKTISLFIVIILATCGLAWLAGKDDVKDWKKDLKAQITQLEENIENEKKAEEPNELFIQNMMNEKELKAYRIEHNMPDNATNPYRFIYMASQNITLIILLFMAAFSADVIASEYSGGTIRQILIKPVKRWKVFVAKFVSTLFVSAILYSFCLIISSIIGFILFGGNTTTIYEPRMIESKIVEINMLKDIGGTVLSQIFGLTVVSTITFFVATLTRKSALAIIVTFILMFGGSAISGLLMKYDIYKYVLMPNLQLDAYMEGGWLPYEGATFTFSLAVCLAYAIAFFSAGLFVFNKRDIY